MVIAKQSNLGFFKNNCGRVTKTFGVLLTQT